MNAAHVLNQRIAKSIEIHLFPTADRRFDTKVKRPIGRASFPTVRSLTRVKCPVFAWVRDGQFWNWLVHNSRCNEKVTLNENFTDFGLKVLWLFQVGHVVQHKQSILSLAWYEWFSREGREIQIYCCGLALSLERQRWKFQVVIWQTRSKNLPQWAHRTCSTIIFPRSTNPIIELWRCRRLTLFTIKRNRNSICLWS